MLAAVRAMCATIVHRGPDDDGFFSDARAALGMRRLSIIDLVTGKQPMSNEDGSVQVVFNGEIYNFKEIRAALESKGHRFLTHSDTEVIPHLYEEYGEDYASHLNGMFGIAIWDRRSRALILTRDRLGVKPLYYALYPDRLVFGSEAKALLAAPGVSREMDPFGLDSYMTYEYIPPPGTIYKELKKLAPGEQLVYRGGEARVRRWWDLPVGPPLNIPEAEAAEQLRELLRDSVRIRLISDVPLGVFLSGGVDSSATAAFAAEFSPHIKSFCIGFDEPTFNEDYYARSVAAALGTDHHEDKLPLTKAIDLLPEIFDKLDEPLSDGSLLPTYLLCRFTRQHVTVALTGDGGDELFAGYQTYQAHKLFSIYRNLPAPMRAAAAGVVAALPSTEGNMNYGFKLKKFLGGVDYDAAARQFIWLGPFAPHEKSGFFTPGFYEQLRGHDIFEPARAALGPQRAALSDIDTAMFLDLRFYLGENLMTKVDRASMMQSLEARTPFLDYRFVELASRLPAHYKLRGWKTKYILKKAVAPVVPPLVLKRRKKGFGVPLTPWIRKQLKENFMETLSPERLRADGIFNPAAVRTILERHLSGAGDERKKLWNLFVFHEWKRRWG
jgi:asparagine synthase (glutamine-hydrolysing)